MSRLAYPPQVIVHHLAGAFCRHRGLALVPREGAGARGAGPSDSKGAPAGPPDDRDAPAAGGDGKSGEGAGRKGPEGGGAEGGDRAAPDGAASEPTGDQVVRDLERAGFVRLDARRAAPRGRRDRVVVLVLAAEGAQAHHSPDLRRLLDSVLSERQAREGRLDEVLVVAEQAFFARKNLTDLIAGHRRAARAARLAAHAPPGDPEGAAIFFDAYRFMTFSLVVPDHSAVPPHRVMGADEAAALLAAANLEPSSLPAIGAADPAAVWIGARDGQVVEITRDSLSVARAPYYRRVDEAL